MAIQIGCPDVESLRRLMLGLAAADEAQSLGEHLLHCARCAETVHSLDATDHLIEAARVGAQAAQHPDQGQIAALIHRLQQIPAPSAAEAPAAENAAGAETPCESDHVADWNVLLAPPQDPSEIGRLGAYRVLSVLGAGGMGVVFEAEDVQLQRLVALKVIQPGRDSREVIARFEAERQALAMMDHPSIAKVLDAGTTEFGRPYFLMELVKGTPITSYCDENRLSVRQRLELMIPVCQAIQHAHHKGIIHRDLKPSNVLITLYDGQPVPKVIDFGLAKATAPTLSERSSFTQFGQLVGTLEYMSPEQAELGQLDIDTRSDIYSLGVLLYELLTGSTPFSRKRVGTVPFDEFLRMIREEEPETVSARIAKTRSRSVQRMNELDWIVMKCLEKDRNRRYETANSLAMDLQRHLDDEPVHACPPSAGYRFRKFVRRNRGPVLAASLVLLALVGGVIGTAIGLVRAERARQAQIERAEGERLAKQEAQQEKANAEARAAEITAVLDFVQSKVLAAARPKDQEGGQGYDVKLADAVKASLPFVNKSFTAQPLIEARLRTTLGSSFSYLGDHTTAIEQREKALALYSGQLGPDHADTLKSMNNLANSYADAGRLQQSLELREETLQLQKAILGPDHPDTLVSMQNLANSYYDTGRTKEAIQLTEETLELKETRLGSDHPETLNSMNNLANSYRAAGRNQDALQLHEKTLLLRQATLGTEHADTLETMNNLANAYANAGRTEEALQFREKTLQIRKVKLGPDHPETLRSMNNLALSYDTAGRSQEALDLREEALQLRKAKLGLDHPDTLRSMSVLASSYSDAGRTKEAIKLFEEALQLQRLKLGADHLDTLRTMGNLGSSYSSAGRAQDALKLDEESLQLRKAKLGSEHPDTLANMNNMANTYYTGGEASKALTILRDTLDSRERRVNAEPGNSVAQSYLAWTHGQMGEAELVQHDFAAALQAFSRSVEMFDKLEQAGVLKQPFFQKQAAHSRLRLVLCGKAEQALKDLDFVLLQPSEEVSQLLNLRLRFLLKDESLPAAVETAAKMKDLAGDNAEQLFGAARAYALCAKAAPLGADATPLVGECAEQAMALVNQAVAKGYEHAARMKQHQDFDALREREDFKELLGELEAKAMETPAEKK